MEKVRVLRLRLVLALLFILLPAVVLAFDFESGGIFYDISYDNATVVKGNSKYVGDIVIPYSVTNSGKTYKVNRIGNYAFQNCEGITSITINADIEKIGANAFEGLQISRLSLPASVTEIEVYAFAKCSKLKSFVIPNSVVTIGVHAFDGCESLENVTIGDGLEKVSDYCFSACVGLRTVVLGNKVKMLSASAFKGCSILETIIQMAPVETIGPECFMGCTKLSSIALSRNAQVIGENAFSGCVNLSEVELAEGLSTIHNYAFSGCESLRQIYIPSSVTTVSDHVFYGCTNLQTVRFGTATDESNTTIGAYSFESCQNLKSLFLGSNVNSVGIYNFDKVGKLDSIVSYSLVPPSVDERTFKDYLHFNYTDSIYEHTTLYVPAEALEAYKAHEVWKKFFNIKALDEQLTLTIKDGDGGVVKLLPTKGQSYELMVEPSEGWTVHSVTYDGEEVTSQLLNGKIFKTPAILKSCVLTVAFEQGGTSVRSVSTDRDIRVLARGSELIVKGTSPGEVVGVYTIDGKAICSETASASTVCLTLAPNQIYIIKVADRSIKIAL